MLYIKKLKCSEFSWIYFGLNYPYDVSNNYKNLI